MKIHHLIHALMILITERPEAKDFDILIPDPHGVYGEEPPNPRLDPHGSKVVYL